MAVDGYSPWWIPGTCRGVGRRPGAISQPPTPGSRLLARRGRRLWPHRGYTVNRFGFLSLSSGSRPTRSSSSLLERSVHPQTMACAWVTSVGHRTPNRGTRGAALRCPRTPVYRVRRRGYGYLRFRGREDRAAKGGAALLALAKHDYPPSWVMPPVRPDAPHGVRRHPGTPATPGTLAPA